jgi:predicted nuclease of restriction endonuclease-like (RecB) superfamily
MNMPSNKSECHDLETRDRTKVHGYEEWIRSIKERIQRARVKASMLVNSEQTLLYWDIGHDILEKQESEGWGAKVVERMSADLKAAFPDMTGLSPRNLKYMRAFADAWARKEIVQAPLAQLPWYHHLALLECLKSRGDRIAYAALAIENGWSRNVMVHQIELGVADLHGTAITNFKKLMPPTDSDMAEQTLRGEYDLGFLPANAKTKENKLRAMLVDKVAKFMVELGAGFSYVGKGLTINVGGDEFEIDLLFYHVVLHRYIVIELKTGKFHPKDLGQLGFYMTAVDRQVKSEIDGKTIGVLLCKSRNDVVAEYSLADLNKPIGVSTYRLGLPPIEQLQAQLRKALTAPIRKGRAR